MAQSVCTVVASALFQNGLTALHHAAMAGESLTCKILVQELHLDPDTPAAVTDGLICGGNISYIFRIDGCTWLSIIIASNGHSFLLHAC